MSLYAIPDIHGRFDLLSRLWEKLDFNPAEDKVVFLGDMIDRGPDSKRVLEFIQDLQDELADSIVVLAGNHEWLAIDACRKFDYHYIASWLQNGGDATLNSYRRLWVAKTGMHHHEYLLPLDVVNWLADLPLFHEEPGYFFSHAPVPRQIDRNSTLRDKPFDKGELTWTYNYPEGHYARNFKDDENRRVVGVCGHVHALHHGKYEPRFYEHYIFADAGCGCHPNAPLVAIDVDNKTYIEAKNGP